MLKNDVTRAFLFEEKILQWLDVRCKTILWYLYVSGYTCVEYNSSEKTLKQIKINDEKFIQRLISIY